MDYKKDEVRRIHKFILSELDTLKNAQLEERLERGNVLYNISKITECYDDIEDILERYFSEKAEKARWEEKEI